MVKEDEKLIIEDGVTVLEPLSFVDCKAKEIIMPDSVETIKHCAFKNCDNLKKIVFGKGIKVIDRDAFHGCHTVNEIVFPEDAVLVMVSIVRGWMAGWQLITTMSSNLYYSLGIVIESFLTTRSEENTSDRLCLSNLNIFDTVSNIFGSEATAKLIAEDVFCDKQMQDALQFFVENRMTIEASALLQKMKEKGIKPYDENFKL